MKSVDRRSVPLPDEVLPEPEAIMGEGIKFEFNRPRYAFSFCWGPSNRIRERLYLLMCLPLYHPDRIFGEFGPAGSIADQSVCSDDHSSHELADNGRVGGHDSHPLNSEELASALSDAAGQDWKVPA